MNFLFNTSAYRPAFKQGGPLHSVPALAEEIVRRGHQVWVSAPNTDLGERMDVDLECEHSVDGVRVRFFESRPTILKQSRIPYLAKSGTYRFGPEFQEWIDAIGPKIDVFHSQITFLPCSSAVSRYASRNNKVYFYHQRGNLDPVRLAIGKAKKLAYIKLVEQRIMRRADALLALTEYERKSFARFAPDNRSAVIPNGIAEDFGRKTELLATDSIRGLLQSFGSKPVFLCMSRIHPTKGQDIFVDAAIQALKTDGDFFAIVAGPDEVGIEAGLRQKVSESGLTDRILFTGSVAGDDRLALLQRADGFVLPTLSEGLSMALLEASACECAVLTTPGAYFDEIADYGAGRIVSRDVDSTTAGLLDFSKRGRDNLGEMGKCGRKLVMEKFTWGSIAEKYLDLAAEIRKKKAQQ